MKFTLLLALDCVGSGANFIRSYKNIGKRVKKSLIKLKFAPNSQNDRDSLQLTVLYFASNSWLHDSVHVANRWIRHLVAQSEVVGRTTTPANRGTDRCSVSDGVGPNSWVVFTDYELEVSLCSAPVARLFDRGFSNSARVGQVIGGGTRRYRIILVKALSFAAPKLLD